MQVRLLTNYIDHRRIENLRIGFEKMKTNALNQKILTQDKTIESLKKKNDHNSELFTKLKCQIQGVKDKLQANMVELNNNNEFKDMNGLMSQLNTADSNVNSSIDHHL